MRATTTPTKQPMVALSITFTGMNHQSRILDRVTDCPSSVKIKQGRNSANTSLIRSLAASGEMILILGCAKTYPNPHMVKTFITGTTESSTISGNFSPAATNLVATSIAAPSWKKDFIFRTGLPVNQYSNPTPF